MSPVGIAHLPNQQHKIATKKGTQFTLIVCGESGLGKTTFINTLFTTTLKNPKNPSLRHLSQLTRTVDIEITKAELEEKNFQVKLTIVDTPGFGDYVNNHNCWTPVVEFIDDQYENYMRQEQQPDRKEIIDMRVHACLYFLRPTGHGLKPLDIEAMKRLGTRVNLIPVIAKADTMTSKDVSNFKKQILRDIEANHITIYKCPEEEGEEEEEKDEDLVKLNKSLMAAMPFAIIASTEDVETPDGRIVKGRSYEWGVAEVENEDHNDFTKLRQLLIRTHLLDLLESTEHVYYENYRMREMVKPAEKQRRNQQISRKYENSQRYREREEMLRKEFTEQVKKEEARFRQWEAQLMAERDQLNRDLEMRHAQIKALEAELEALYYQTGSNNSTSSSTSSIVRR
ncbi:Septin-domain-containing protein [Cokeromyces recurvatus]|uniref:Septin-domain-containing protein n=1 Tax=Cokeromyces recurvatus TaxID=90255 RepID=UPI00221FA8B4|nr:Septin-domain-containing protein [Cokeromyces recurvatus]KAI7899548.1 Septin-domain-containing protein [Cokeromyces recurvatus]